MFASSLKKLLQEHIAFMLVEAFGDYAISHQMLCGTNALMMDKQLQTTMNIPLRSTTLETP